MDVLAFIGAFIFLVGLAAVILTLVVLWTISILTGEDGGETGNFLFRQMIDQDKLLKSGAHFIIFGFLTMIIGGIILTITYLSPLSL